MPQLFKAPTVDGFEKAALLDAIGRCNVITGKIILFKGLDEMSSRGMFLEMKVHQCSELLFEIHLKRSVPSCYQRMGGNKGILNRVQ
jgi:hypothetical protein